MQTKIPFFPENTKLINETVGFCEMEYWVNAIDGKPYFYITADVNEKMIEMLNAEIIPKLLELHPVSQEHKKRMEEDENEPLFTLVFDREAYPTCSPDGRRRIIFGT